MKLGSRNTLFISPTRYSLSAKAAVAPIGKIAYRGSRIERMTALGQLARHRPCLRGPDAATARRQLIYPVNVSLEGRVRIFESIAVLVQRN